MRTLFIFIVAFSLQIAAAQKNYTESKIYYSEKVDESFANEKEEPMLF
jgi:hypothetical protein